MVSIQKSSLSPLPDWRQLKFEFRETDYMFLAQTDEEGRWRRGQICPFQDLKISPAAAVLNYGQAVFEGMKALRSTHNKIVLFRPDENARRFQRSAERLLMPTYPADEFIAAVEEVVRANVRWVPPCESGSMYIRPVMIGSGPVLGVGPACSYTFYIFVSPVGPYLPGEGKLIVLDETHRSASHGTGDIKAAANYPGTFRPRKIAQEKGYKDVLYLDACDDRYVEELGSSNFFIVLKDGSLATPQLRGSILPGIIRDSVITIARKLYHWKVQERDVSINEVLTEAQEAFFTGTAATVQPVMIVHYKGTDYRISGGQAEEEMRARKLSQCLLAIQMQQQPDPFGWVWEVDL